MKKIALSLVAVAAAFATSAQAAIDTTPVTTALTDGGAACTVVGLAALAVVAGVKTIKMIRTAL